MRFDEAVAWAEERADFAVALTRDPTDVLDDAVAAAIAVTDQSGRSVLVEVGTGADGAYASVSSWFEDEEAEPQVFAVGNSVMVVVNETLDG